MANIELDGANKKIKVDSGDLTLDVPGDIILDADGADLVFADGGTNILKVTNSSSDVVFQPQVDAKDIIFKQYDGTTVATVEDNGTFNIPTDKLAINGTAVTATAAEINLIDGGTARGTTAIADGDGVLINDAGTMRMTTVETLKTYIGGADPSSADGDSLGTASLEWSDLYLADGGVIYFGNDQEITLTHSADSGLLLKHTATADDKPINLVLQTGETDLAADDVIGKISFQAPDEGTGTDAVLISAAIQARAEGDHSSSSNATSLDFLTGASEAAAKQWSLLSTGHWLPAATDHGIYLGIDSVNAAHLLDDYEEGTWTPNWASNGGSVTGSSSVSGKYIKIGKCVMLQAQGTLTTSSATGYYKFTNAPFQADGNFTGSGHEFGQTGTQQIVWMDDNSTQVNIKKYDGSIIANPYLRLNIFYHTD